MIVLTILAALSAAAAPDSARAAARLDSVIALPEVRVEGERPARGARARMPTAFASDLSAGATGHALETLPDRSMTTTEEERYLDLRLSTLDGARFSGQMVEEDGRLVYLSLFLTDRALVAIS